MSYKIEETTVQKIYTFTTIGFFHDGIECHQLNNEWLNNGRRYIENVDGELIYSVIEKSSDYLSKQIDNMGKFRYGYFPCFNKEIKGYNMLRHASTTYSMIEAYEIRKDEQLGQAIKRSLNFLVCYGIELLTDSEGIKRGFVVERTNNNEIKLGANAAAILALSKYSRVFNDYKYVQTMEYLAEGIDYCHDKQDGSFVHVLNFPDLSIKEKFRVIYYDGEAAFALMRLYDIDKNERWLNITEQVFEYFIRERYWYNHDHWLSYCSNELLKYKLEKKYIEFNLKNASGILDFCLTRETTYPTLLELLMATYNMIERMKSENCFLEALEYFDEEKFIRAIDHRAEHQLNGLYFPEVAMYFKSPESILWAFYIRHHSLRARIDDIEHNISGYCSYLHQRIKSNYGCISSSDIENSINNVSEFDSLLIDDEASALENFKLNDKMKNAKTFLRIPTPYDDGTEWEGRTNQATHPSVVQFATLWNGYKYWMSYTPYPYAKSIRENPCIAASNDGIKWDVPAGAKNPLVDAPNYGSNAYNSDSHLFYNDFTLRLELWYREVLNNTTEKLYRVTSLDGVIWTEPELLATFTSKYILQAISPSVIFEDGKYKLWVMSDWYIQYSESTDGKTWGEPVLIKSNGKKVHSWHPNVVKIGSTYYLLNCDKTSNLGVSGEIKYSTSTDGINFTEEKHLLTYTDNEFDYDGAGVYRSSILIEDHRIMLYYGTFSHDGKWMISMTVGSGMENLVGINEQVIEFYS
jgi:hypothetical protein